MDDGTKEKKRKKGIFADLYCKHIEINISVVAYTPRIKECKHIDRCIYIWIDGYIMVVKEKEESYHQAFSSGIVNKSTNGINAV